MRGGRSEAGGTAYTRFASSSIPPASRCLSPPRCSCRPKHDRGSLPGYSPARPVAAQVVLDPIDGPICLSELPTISRASGDLSRRLPHRRSHVESCRAGWRFGPHSAWLRGIPAARRIGVSQADRRIPTPRSATIASHHVSCGDEPPSALAASATIDTRAPAAEIASRTPAQPVASAVAPEGVVAQVPLEEIGASSAEQAITAAPTKDAVTRRAAAYHVVAAAGANEVAAGARDDHVVSTERNDHIGAIGTGQLILSGSSLDRRCYSAAGRRSLWPHGCLFRVAVVGRGRVPFIAVGSGRVAQRARLRGPGDDLDGFRCASPCGGQLTDVAGRPPALERAALTCGDEFDRVGQGVGDRDACRRRRAQILNLDRVGERAADRARIWAV